MTRKPRAPSSKPIDVVFDEFGFHLANGTFCPEILGGVDYQAALENDDVIEGVSSVFSDALEFGGAFEVLNAESAKRRAAQWIRQRVDPTYVADPPFPDPRTG